MKRILLAWELGGGYGHVAIMRGVAQALRELGHECIFAVRELRPAEEYLPPELGIVVQAPRSPIQARSPVNIQTSYASLLHNTGFDDPIDLAGRLRSWIELLRAFRIDAVLANHAPVALLAARALELPRGQFGASFGIPPLVSPFPGFQPQLQVKDSILQHNETEVLRALNQALQRLRLSPLEQLQQIFEGLPHPHLRLPGTGCLRRRLARTRQPHGHCRPILWRCSAVARDAWAARAGLPAPLHAPGAPDAGPAGQPAQPVGPHLRHVAGKTACLRAARPEHHRAIDPSAPGRGSL